MDETVFLNVYGAPESIPRNEFRQPCSLAGRYDNPLPPRFLAPIDSLKIPALEARGGFGGEGCGEGGGRSGRKKGDGTAVGGRSGRSARYKVGGK
jgi:hypothetical protein